MQKKTQTVSTFIYFLNSTHHQKVIFFFLPLDPHNTLLVKLSNNVGGI